MRNFRQPGVNLTVAAPAAVTSGQGVLLGSIFGVASNDAAAGADVVLVTEGVFDLPKVAADAFAAGAPAYRRPGDGLMTATAAGNLKVGVAVLAAANPSAIVAVRLNGTF